MRQIKSSSSCLVSDPPGDSQCWHMSQCVPFGHVGRTVQVLCVHSDHVCRRGQVPYLAYLCTILISFLMREYMTQLI